MALAILLLSLAACGGEDADVEGLASKPEPYALVQQLREAGHDEVAAKLAADIARARPDEPPPRLFDKSRLEKIGAFVRSAAIPSAVAVVLASLGFLFGRKLWWLLREERYVGVVLGTFSAPKDHEGIAASLRARIADELDVLVTPVRSFLAPGVGGLDLPDLLDLPESVRFLGPFVSWLRRPPHLRIVGTLHLFEDRCGVSIEITTDSGRALNRRHFPCEGRCGRDMQLLAIDAAAWCAFDLQSRRYRIRRDPRAVFGTQHWNSLAAVQKSAISEGREEDHWTRVALQVDPHNTAAMLTQGCRDSDGYDRPDLMQRGVRRLEIVVDAMKGSPDPNPLVQLNSQWFQAKYALVIALLHRATILGRQPNREDESRKDLDRALREATELARSIGATGLLLDQTPARRTLNDRQRNFLRTMLELDAVPFLIVLAGVKVTVELRELRQALAPTTASPAPLDKRVLWRRLVALEDEDLPNAKELIGWLVEPFMGPTGRYNLACFYTRARDYDDALENLGLAFEVAPTTLSRQFARVVYSDPALSELARVRPAEFRRIVSSVSPTVVEPASSPRDEDWTIVLDSEAA
jgi:hypothetical protein